MALNIRCANFLILLEPPQLKHVLEVIASGEELDFRHMGLLPAVEIDLDITDMTPEQAAGCLARAFPQEH